MLSFNNRATTTTQNPLSAVNQIVVFNAMDHESLIAANLYKASTPMANVKLLDIRDPIAPAEGYVWLNCGDAAAIGGYLSEAIEAEQLPYILKNSTFINGPQLLNKLSEVVVARNGGGIEQWPLLTKWSISANVFHTQDIEIERLVRYYELIKRCHAAHQEGSDYSADIEILSVEASPSEVEAFMQEQKRINIGLANKVRHSSYNVKGGGTIPFIMFSTTDVIGLYIIRRALSTGRNFLHHSMGVYGEVVFSNRNFDAEHFTTNNNHICITFQNLN